MQIDYSRFELLELTALLIDTNRQFTDALKARRPHAELVEIYDQIQAIYNQITHLKERDKIAA